MTGVTSLYRLYDDAGHLLYIGISRAPYIRFAEHRKTRWGSQIDSHTVQRFPTREQAAEAERRAIVAERPLHNSIRATPQPDIEVTALAPPPEVSAAPGKIELAAAAEIAQILGVGQARTHTIIRVSADFPEPIAHLRVGKIWLASDVHDWAVRNGYRSEAA